MIKRPLVEHGIFCEKSDIRAHVSNRIVYVFKTRLVVKTISENRYRSVFAKQPGVKYATARGFLVPPKDIPGCQLCRHEPWPYWSYFDAKWDTSRKGRWAVCCVTDMIERGRFPLWLPAKQTRDIQLDRAGTDIVVAADKRIQVKCDYPASKTGNLYIQTHEINPLNKH